MLTTPSCLWHELEIVEKVKYLGVIIQSAMKFTAAATTATTDATATVVGISKHNLLSHKTTPLSLSPPSSMYHLCDLTTQSLEKEPTHSY